MLQRKFFHNIFYNSWNIKLLLVLILATTTLLFLSTNDLLLGNFKFLGNYVCLFPCLELLIITAYCIMFAICFMQMGQIQI